MNRFSLPMSAAMVLFLMVAVTPPVMAETITTVSAQEPLKVVVQAQDRGNGQVSGVIRNLSDDVINEVTLLIQHTWQWKDEFHPGPEEANPGRAEFQTISQSIAPNGAVEFRYTPSPPLPHRADGHFDTTVTVHQYTATGDIDEPLVP